MSKSLKGSKTEQNLLKAFVITSYSIHYTKLYDWIKEPVMLLLRPMFLVMEK